MKVWIVTKEYWESSDVKGVFDSRDKAIEYVKKQFKDKNVKYEREDLGVEITFYCQVEESLADYIINEWDVE